MKVSVIIVFIVFLIIGSFLLFSPANNTQESTPAISTLEGVDLYGNPNNIFLDVRTLDEHKTISIPNSLIIPVQELESRVNELKKYKDQNIVVYCRSGNRSRTGTEILINNGYNAVNLSGGIINWTGPVSDK